MSFFKKFISMTVQKKFIIGGFFILFTAVVFGLFFVGKGKFHSINKTESVKKAEPPNPSIMSESQKPKKSKRTIASLPGLVSDPCPGQAGASHFNGGGFVANTAEVEDSFYVFIGPNAKVCDNAKIIGSNARVFDNAKVFGNAQISGNVGIYDDAQVGGNARVAGNARVSENAQVGGNAVIMGNAQVYGHAIVRGDAVVAGNVRVSGDAIIEGDDEFTGDERIR